MPSDIDCADLEHDVDGDGLKDLCDSDNTDGPRTDADRGGVTNATDTCLTVPNAAQTDSDNDGVCDACDPDSGHNPIDTFRTPGITSGAASTTGSVGTPYEFQFTATGNS